MNPETVLWALGTGFVTGGVFVAIFYHSRMKRLSEDHRIHLEDLERRLDELGPVDQRLAQAEERMDFTERLLPPRPEEP